MKYLASLILVFGTCSPITFVTGSENEDKTCKPLSDVVLNTFDKSHHPIAFTYTALSHNGCKKKGLAPTIDKSKIIIYPEGTIVYSKFDNRDQIIRLVEGNKTSLKDSYTVKQSSNSIEINFSYSNFKYSKDMFENFCGIKINIKHDAWVTVYSDRDQKFDEYCSFFPILMASTFSSVERTNDGFEILEEPKKIAKSRH